MRAKAMQGLPFIADIADDLQLRLSPVRRDFEKALNLFPPHPSIGKALLATGKIGTLTQIGLDQLADPETLPLEEAGFDLIVSCLGLQFANDLPGVLAQLYRALKPGGLLLGCLVSGESLKELREAFALAEMETTGGITPRIHPAIDIKQLGSLLQRTKFTEPVTDVEKYVFHYSGSVEMLKDLQDWSLGNLMTERSRKFLKRATLARLDAIYREKFGAGDKKIKARFDLLWFSGWRPER